MVAWVADAHKVSNGGVPTDFTRGRAGKEGSLRLVLERVKLAPRDGRSSGDGPGDLPRLPKN